MHPHGDSQRPTTRLGSQQFLEVFRYGGRAMRLVWATSPRLTLILAGLTLVIGLLPAAIAYVGKVIVDGVLQAIDTGDPLHRTRVLWAVGIEGVLVLVVAAGQRGISVCRALLRAQLGHRVNRMILDKAVTLQLSQFEDSEFYNKLTQARREASSRPLSLVISSFGLVQNAISLTTYGALLIGFSPLAAAVLVLAGLPAFFVETKFSSQAFRLFKWQSTEAREQMYLETVAAREDYAKEVKLFGLGNLLTSRYSTIFRRLYAEDRSLTLRRGFWGFSLGLLGTLAFYGVYAWIAWAAVAVAITLGEMTMYLLLFKQGQSAVSASLSTIGTMYEDNLYLSTLYEFLEQEVPTQSGSKDRGDRPQDGLVFEKVCFRYPGANCNALQDIDLRIAPGQKLALVGANGAGKTTLIKLMSRLYDPTAGRILLDGLDLREWKPESLRRRISVIFQDFARYQFFVGENIGVGDVEGIADESRWLEAGDKGMATEFVAQLPKGYHTQLGRWFRDGQELSGGQWQKIALSRMFMRREADILVLDEPTAAMDAEAENKIFEHVRNLSREQMAILISHRFSTVRMAEEIVVLDQGRICERGTHEELLVENGRYAHLFNLQAAGYQ